LVCFIELVLNDRFKVFSLLRYHRRFIEVANNFYISKLNTDTREAVFSNVVDFFNETWKDNPKPFKFNQRIVKKKQLESDDAKESRNTTSQLTEYIDEDGVIRYNKRKLTELPGFISQMSFNIGIPLACKHLYFNYEFSHGMFACLSFSSIFESFDNFLSASSYSMEKSAKDGFEEMNVLFLLYLQCATLMSDHSDAVAIEMLSRILIFYGYLPYFTDFIKQADNCSKNHCALVAAYQSTTPPGIGPIFTLQKHSKPINFTIFCDKLPYVFTLSNKIHALSFKKIVNLGEIILPKLNDQDYYKQMIVYFEEDLSDDIQTLKTMFGSIIVVSDSILHSVKLDSSLNFTKVFENKKIKNIFQITPSHVLVLFDQEKYFEVYDFNSGKIDFIQNYEFNVKYIETRLKKDEANTPDSFDSATSFFIVVLENSEIHSYRIIYGEGTEIKIEISTLIKSPGCDCIGVKFQKFEYIPSIKGPITSFSFQDGSIMFLQEYYLKNNSQLALTFMKLKKEVNNAKLTVLDACFKIILFLSDDCFIYIIDENNEEMELIKIGGVHNNGFIYKENLIVGLNGGALSFYLISKNYEDKTYKGLLIATVDAHFMDISGMHIYKKGTY